MKLTVQHHYLRSSDELDSFIENRILALQPRLQIDEAIVRLECRFEESPAFAARVHIVTPGPDVLAERRDHTLRAAVEKVLAEVETKVTGRVEKRRQRIRSKLQEPAMFRRGTGRR